MEKTITKLTYLLLIFLILSASAHAVQISYEIVDDSPNNTFVGQLRNSFMSIRNGGDAKSASFLFSANNGNPPYKWAVTSPNVEGLDDDDNRLEFLIFDFFDNDANVFYTIKNSQNGESTPYDYFNGGQATRQTVFIEVTDDDGVTDIESFDLLAPVRFTDKISEKIVVVDGDPITLAAEEGLTEQAYTFNINESNKGNLQTTDTTATFNALFVDINARPHSPDKITLSVESFGSKDEIEIDIYSKPTIQYSTDSGTTWSRIIGNKISFLKEETVTLRRDGGSPTMNWTINSESWTESIAKVNSNETSYNAGQQFTTTVSGTEVDTITLTPDQNTDGMMTVSIEDHGVNVDIEINFRSFITSPPFIDFDPRNNDPVEIKIITPEDADSSARYTWSYDNPNISQGFTTSLQSITKLENINTTVSTSLYFHPPETLTVTSGNIIIESDRGDTVPVPVTTTDVIDTRFDLTPSTSSISMKINYSKYVAISGNSNYNITFSDSGLMTVSSNLNGFRRDSLGIVMGNTLTSSFYLHSRSKAANLEMYITNLTNEDITVIPIELREIKIVSGSPSHPDVGGGCLLDYGRKNKITKEK